MARKIDFLRHIVNRVLAESKLSPQLIDDVRKRIGYAEERYKFSAFGGDVRRLADFLRSREFDELITVFKSGNAVDKLYEILRIAREKYSDVAELVPAIDEALAKVEKAMKEKKQG
jgi:hypothetical protein